MLRKSKSYVRPKKAYEKTRIQEENVLLEKYGLKSKREVWKAQAKVSYFRRRAKDLAKAPHAEQEVLFGKLQSIGLKTHSIADVLALGVEDLLKRRLTSVVVQKGLAKTTQQARQMVVHRKVSIHNRVVTIPSYIVQVSDESALNAQTPVDDTSKPKEDKE